jgi:CRISPR-associated protein Cas6
MNREAKPMFWQDEDEKQELRVPEDIVDLVFNIECRELPVDHAHALSVALRQALPLLEEDTRFAIHNIHLAGSQNGWERPDPKLGQKLMLSRRTKLTLRAPNEHRESVEQTLNGLTLDIEGHPLTVGKAKVKLLSRQGTIFARHVALEEGENEDENAFLMRIVNELKSRDIRVKKALCGITQPIETPDGPLLTRSLMLADLNTEASLQLQQQGLGSHRLLGCGIFLPHKGIDAVKKAEDE